VTVEPDLHAAVARIKAAMRARSLETGLGDDDALRQRHNPVVAD
jgi:hypothetical protein